jgi:hypothetical protein
MRLILLAPALLLLGAAAPQKRDRIPEATPAGEAVSCINTNLIRQTHVRSDRIIDFEMAGGKIYRNELPYDCPSLSFERRFLHRDSTNRYCSVDIITVLRDPPIGTGASCGLGKFQPVTLAKQH